MIEKVTDTICLWTVIAMHWQQEKLWSSILLFGVLKALSAIVALLSLQKTSLCKLFNDIIYI